jgi:hypothetical protein
MCSADTYCADLALIENGYERTPLTILEPISFTLRDPDDWRRIRDDLLGTAI